MSIHGVLILTDFNYVKTKKIIDVSPKLKQRRVQFLQDRYCTEYMPLDEDTVQEYLKRERF